MQSINLYSKEQIDTIIENIDVDLSNYYTKSEIDTIIENIDVDLSNYYTKSEIDTIIENIDVDLSNYYTKSEIDNMIPDVTNYYTKSQSDSKYGDVEIINIDPTQLTYNNTGSDLRAILPDIRVGDKVIMTARTKNGTASDTFILDYYSSDSNKGSYSYNTITKTVLETGKYPINRMRGGLANHSINGVYHPVILYNDYTITYLVTTGQHQESYASPDTLEFVTITIIRKKTS